MGTRMLLAELRKDKRQVYISGIYNVSEEACVVERRERMSQQ